MIIDSPNATGVVSGFGVPTGGTSGQILQKVNATNYNTQWVDPYVYGEIAIPSITLNNTTADAVSFTLPSAGVWKVTQIVRVTTNINTIPITFLTTTANVRVPNSELLSIFTAANPTNGQQSTASQISFITTTGATTYKLRFNSQIGESNISSDNNGRSKIIFEKVG